MLLKQNESINNFEELHQEVLTAYTAKKETLKQLYEEIKIVKRLRV